MQHPKSKQWFGPPSPAMAVAVVALIVALSGSAWAAFVLEKNSVGTRQLKSKAVTTGKLANNAVNGAKVANQSLTGTDINISALGTVPKATDADHAANADSLGEGHAAACPAATTLIRGICFDSASNSAVAGVKVAADACAAKGGYLPTPMELYSTRSVLNLGTGVGTDHQYTDSYYANTIGGNYSTVVINGEGALTEQSITTPSRYICAYPLVR